MPPLNAASFPDLLTDDSSFLLADAFKVRAKTALASRDALSKLFSKEETYADWLGRLGKTGQEFLKTLAFGPALFTESELDLKLPTDLKREFIQNRILYEKRHSLPTLISIHPGMRAYLIKKHLTIPSITDSTPVEPNPTFHPLIPLRLFLAAISGESYRVLSDDSFFFKPSAKKIFGKFSNPPPAEALHLLFQFSVQFELIRIKRGKAELSLDTLYHLNFHEANFLYFSYFFLSPLSLLFGAFREKERETWFDMDGVNAFLKTTATLPIPRMPVRTFANNPTPLNARDLLFLGLLIEKTIDKRHYVKPNPWYADWLFDHVPSLKRNRPSDFKRKFLVQPNYAILMPPDLAWPSYLQLISLAKTTRCDAVCHLNLSKASLKHGLEMGVDPLHVVSFFEANANSLPPNVRLSLLDWSSTNTLKKALHREDHDNIQTEELRKEVNHHLALPLIERLDHLPDKGRSTFAIFGGEFPPLPEPSLVTPSIPEEEKSSQALTHTRKTLFFLEECVRSKTPCKILYRSRAERTRERLILPRRLHRDGVYVYIEAECPELNAICDFKLADIVEIHPSL